MYGIRSGNHKVKRLRVLKKQMTKSMAAALLFSPLLTVYMWSSDNSHVLGATDLFCRL